MKKEDNTRKVILVLTLAIIVALIAFFEGTKPKTEKFETNVDIKIEDLSQTNQTMQQEQDRTLTQADRNRIEEKAKTYSRAKELVGPEGFINSEPFTLSDYIGEKVILIDFWTYSCINCQRTFPYLTAWDETYRDNGLLIVGIHAPEFQFEQDYDNVVAATEKWGIKYPVVQDNDHQTWNAYNNRYWPRKYLIDIDGFIVYDHIGEGGYAQTELKIRELLAERKKVIEANETFSSKLALVSEQAPEFNKIGTPEIYFGYSFSRNQMGNPEGWKISEEVSYQLPSRMVENLFYLDGRWFNHMDNMESKSQENEIRILYDARKINLVAGADEPVEIKVYIDDEFQKSINISDFDLYELYDAGRYEKHNLRIETPAGLKAYTFTFG